jgi:glyoxylase-like metal-dependent hydrolase (beta-lactamase superfamily II)
MQILKYGNTNTYFLKGRNGSLLIDTDYAGTMSRFFKSIKAADISIRDISYVIATHYHPDHMGIIGDLQRQGVKLVIVDVQQDFVHFSDRIFAGDKHLFYTPVDEKNAVRISCAESRGFLDNIGICGEILHTPSHSKDSVSVVLDDGNCFVGDLERMEYLGSYEDNVPLKADWDTILEHRPVTVYYAHSPEYVFTGDDRSRAR